MRGNEYYFKKKGGHTRQAVNEKTARKKYDTEGKERFKLFPSVKGTRKGKRGVENF